MIRVILKSSGMWIDKVSFVKAPRLDHIMSALHINTFREHNIYDSGKEWRKVYTIDTLGIRMLYDLEIQQVIDVYFRLTNKSYAKDILEPTSAFSGLLLLNGVRLVSDMKSKLLPINGAFTFKREGGWVAQSDLLFVHMRTSAQYRSLHSVVVTFLNRERYSFEK